MAKVQVKKLDGTIVEMVHDNVGEVRQALGLGAQFAGSINGEPADDDEELEEFQFVSFAEKVKGGI